MNKQPNVPGIGPRRNDEIVLELTLVAVIIQIDPGVNLLILDPGVGGDIREPRGGIVANEIVDRARQLVETDDFLAPAAPTS